LVKEKEVVNSRVNVQLFKYRHMNENLTLLGTVSFSNPHVLVAVTYDDWKHSKTFFNNKPMTQNIELFGTKQDCQKFKVMLQKMMDLIQIEDHQV
jgi:hypothetical protein